MRRAGLICHTGNTQPQPPSRSFVLPRLSPIITCWRVRLDGGYEYQGRL
jgi:hypothetical protein